MSNQNEMVVAHDKEPFTNTLIISEGVGLEHKNIIALVRKFKSDFEEFGTFAFQTRKSGGRATEFAELNEDQATYLITLLKNTETDRAFKIRLVKAFRKALKELERLRKQTNELELNSWIHCPARKPRGCSLTGSAALVRLSIR